MNNDIQKVAYRIKDGSTTVTIHFCDDDGAVYRVDYAESPRPEFYNAFQKLCPYVFSQILGIEPNFPINNPTTVNGITLKEKDGTTNVAIQLTSQLADGVDWKINTPSVCLEAQSEFVFDAVADIIKEAQAYLAGERAQMNLAV